MKHQGKHHKCCQELAGVLLFRRIPNFREFVITHPDPVQRDWCLIRLKEVEVRPEVPQGCRGPIRQRTTSSQPMNIHCHCHSSRTAVLCSCERPGVSRPCADAGHLFWTAGSSRLCSRPSSVGTPMSDGRESAEYWCDRFRFAKGEQMKFSTRNRATDSVGEGQGLETADQH